MPRLRSSGPRACARPVGMRPESSAGPRSRSSSAPVPSSWQQRRGFSSSTSPAGPPGASVRHLLGTRRACRSRATRRRSRGPVSAASTRTSATRAWLRCSPERAEMPFADYLVAAVLEPLRDDGDRGAAGSARHGGRRYMGDARRSLCVRPRALLADRPGARDARGGNDGRVSRARGRAAGIRPPGSV